MTQQGRAIEEVHTVNQMETAKGSMGVFELPCGHLNEDGELKTEVEVREITGHEEDMLASEQVPNAQKITALLRGCVKRIGDVTEPGPLSRMVRELTMGDRVFLVFAIRRVTLGDELPVRERCPECKVNTLFMVDLKEELQPKAMPDPYKRIYDVELPSGKSARFRVSMGDDEVKMMKIRQRKQAADAVSHAIMMRLELLDGEKPTLQMVKSLGMRDRIFIREQYQEVEGGVDTTLELECPSCGNDWEKELDLSAASFFFPGGQQKR